MMSDLKPCPFCGCKMYIVREGVRVAAEGGHDTDCIMLGIVESYSNVAILVKDLNKRPADTVVVPRYPDAELAWRMIEAFGAAIGEDAGGPGEEELQDAVKAVTAMIAATGGE